MSRAAGRLMMTQQAVSGQIRQLERVVGTPLVRRLSSGVELTPAGQVVLKQGRSLLTASTAMVSEARLVGAGRSGRLRIAFKAQSTAHFMPEVEAALHRVAPDLEVEPLAAYTLLDEIAALVDGTADAAFLWLPIGDDPRFVTHPLMDEPRWVALPLGHRLASRSSLCIADLADEPVRRPTRRHAGGRGPVLVHRPAPGRQARRVRPAGAHAGGVSASCCRWAGLLDSTLFDGRVLSLSATGLDSPPRRGSAAVGVDLATAQRQPAVGRVVAGEQARHPRDTRVSDSGRTQCWLRASPGSVSFACSGRTRSATPRWRARRSASLSTRRGRVRVCRRRR